MKKLMIVATSFPDREYQPALGEGAGAFVLAFARRLARLVRVMAVVPSGCDGEEELENGLVARRFKVPRLPVYQLKPQNPANWPDLARTLWAGRRAVTRAAREFEPDHILAAWLLPSGWWASAAGRPYSLWALGSDFHQLAHWPGVRQVMRRVTGKADFLFANSRYLADKLKRFSGREAFFLPTASPLQGDGLKRPAEAPPYKLAYLGRWEAIKGVDLFLEALEQLTDEDWRKISEVRIHGSGLMEPLVRAKSQSLRNQGRPVNDGRLLDRAGARELLAWADYVVISSRQESLPATYSESLMNRAAVVASPAGDLPRLLEEFKVGELAGGIGAEPLARAIRLALGRSPAFYAPNFARALEMFDLGRAAADFISLTRLG